MTETSPQDQPVPTDADAPDEPTSPEPLTDPESTAARHAAARPVPVPPAANPTPPPPPAPQTNGPSTRPVAVVAPLETRTDLAPVVDDGPVPEPADEIPDQLVAPATEPTADGPATPGDPTAPTDPTPPAAPGSGASIPLGAPLPLPSNTEDRAYAFPDPHPPTAPGWGSHVLGSLVGLVVAPVGAIALLLGQSRVLEVQTDTEFGQVELLGITLVLLGAAVLIALVLLASWTASAPITGGVVTMLIGAYALIAPGYFGDNVLLILSSDVWQITVVQTIVAAGSGTLFLAGALMLAAGLAAADVRRRGVRLGAFRERHGAAS